MDATQMRAKILGLQRTLAIVSTVLMAIGGFVIGLGIHLRHVIRLVPPGSVWSVTTISNLFLASGILQIVYSSSCCFASIWQLDRLITVGFYCGFFFVIVPEVGAFVNAFLLQFPGDTHYTEHIYRAWYVWECLEMGSCGKAYTAYIRIYLLPQMILTLAAIILHGYTMYQVMLYLQLAGRLRERIEAGIARRAYRDLEESRV